MAEESTPLETPPDYFNEVKMSQAVERHEQAQPVTDTNPQDMHNDPTVPVTVGGENVSDTPVIPYEPPEPVAPAEPDTPEEPPA